MKTAKQKLISVIIPLYNEEQVFPELSQRLNSCLKNIAGYDYEIIFVNDGSRDSTWELVSKASQDNSKIVAINLSRNFGQQAALAAAMDFAEGDVIIMMDGDLQDPPEVIVTFLQHYEAGCDVVYARRARRKENALLRFCYYSYYRLLARVSSTAIPTDSGDFALMSRRVLQAIRQSKENPKFLRGLRAWAGYKQIGIEVERPARFAGESKYTLLKLIKLAFDGIFSFSTLPLRLVSVAGFGAILLSSIYGAYVVYVRIVENKGPSGFAATVLTVVFMSGVQLVFLGAIAEYIARIFDQNKGRPSYLVDQVIGAKAQRKEVDDEHSVRRSA